MMYVITPNIASGLVPSSCTGIAYRLPVCKSSRCGFGDLRYLFILNSPSILQTSNEPSHGDNWLFVIADNADNADNQALSAEVDAKRFVLFILKLAFQIISD